MIRSIAVYLTSIPPVFVDGTLYALVAMFGFLQAQFGSDDAAKYLSPVHLFWIKTVVGAMASVALAMKLYRSTSYADHQQKLKDDTAFFRQQPPPVTTTTTPPKP